MRCVVTSTTFTEKFEHVQLIAGSVFFLKGLPGRELNPGLPRDRRGYSPLYYRGLWSRLPHHVPVVKPIGLIGDQNGSAQRGARTHDPEIKSLVLYRLS